MNKEINFRALGLFIMAIGLVLNLISTKSVLHILVAYQINLVLMITGIALLIYSNIKTYKTIKSKRVEELAALKHTIELESNQLN